MTPIDSTITDLVVDALDDLKAVDTKIVDVRDLSSVTDFLVVASGNSSRHVKSLADNVVVKAKE
ncbi:RsfS/YbeB/iojap family protein, partial [Luminiphilus sp.]|nr:RsfS/YbeB/iojap family protein [Luminiphilus sp.]